jgi:hypothetical protein
MYEILLANVSEALERMNVEQDRIVKEFTMPGKLPGFAVRLELSDLAEFGAQLAVSVADEESRHGHDDVEEATKRVRMSLRQADLAEDGGGHLLVFPYHVLVGSDNWLDNDEEASKRD